MADSTGRNRWWGRRSKRAEARSARATEPAEHADTDDVTQSIPYGMRLAGAWSWRLLLVLGVSAVLVFLIIQLRLVLIPVLVAVLVSALLVPFSGFLQRHSWPKWLAVTVAMLSAITVIGGLLTLGITQIVRGSDELAAQSIVAWNGFRDWLVMGPLHLTQTQLDNAVQQIVTSVQQDMGVVVNGALSVGSSLGHFVAGMFLAIFATLFFLIDGAGIWRWIVSIFPRRARPAVDDAGRSGWTTLGSFVRVQILVATIDAIGIGLGAFFLGVPLAAPIAILVFLGSFVPIVGAIVTGALAVFVALVYNGFGIALIMLGVVLLVQQVEGHILQPLIMGTAVKVHPLGVVLAVTTGSLVAGIAGAFFAVPFVAVLNTMILAVSSGRWKDRSRAELVGGPPPTNLWRTVPQKPGFRRGAAER